MIAASGANSGKNASDSNAAVLIRAPREPAVMPSSVAARMASHTAAAAAGTVSMASSRTSSRWPEPAPDSMVAACLDSVTAIAITTARATPPSWPGGAEPGTSGFSSAVNE
jgi:hypothetical protein